MHKLLQYVTNSSSSSCVHDTNAVLVPHQHTQAVDVELRGWGITQEVGGGAESGEG
jgi:hypothetical protein